MSVRVPAQVRVGEPTGLSLEAFESVVRGGARVELAPAARARMLRSRAIVEARANEDQAHYGVNTGFGSLASKRISKADLAQLQLNFLRSHAAGMGEPLANEIVRGMLLLRAHSLAIGYSGVRPAVVERLLLYLNRRIHPVVPAQGSVGASGDLAPLAALALPLIGEGEVEYRGEVRSTRAVLRALRLQPLRLGAKEGLALTNGTQLMGAHAGLLVRDAERLAELCDAVGALSLEALLGSMTPFDARIHAVRAHPGQVRSAARLRAWLAPGGQPSALMRSHVDCARVQDPYSFRCMPQVHGASLDAIAYVRAVVEREFAAVTDNPLVFAGTAEGSGEILTGGNFHGQPLALALDVLAIAIAELASIAHERLSRLVNPATSGLPMFLAREPGLESGWMVAQYTAAALVSENKTLAHPASVDSILTNIDREDHVSMGAWGARKCRAILANTRKVVAVELGIAAVGVEMRRPLKPSLPLARLLARVRPLLPKSKQGDVHLSPVLTRLEAQATRWIEGREALGTPVTGQLRGRGTTSGRRARIESARGQ